MANDYDIKVMAEKISILRKTAEELKEMSGGLQAVERNVDRILSATRLLELNITDVFNVLLK